MQFSISHMLQDPPAMQVSQPGSQSLQLPSASTYWSLSQSDIHFKVLAGHESQPPMQSVVETSLPSSLLDYDIDEVIKL